MKSIPRAMLLAALFAGSAAAFSAAGSESAGTPMQGVPPTRESQVTMANYRDYPMSMWAFRNADAVLNTVMIPRQGDIRPLPGPLRPEIGERLLSDAQGNELSFDALFEANYADGVLVMQGSRLLHEAYFHDFNERSHHIWFSMTKSLVSTVFGLLVAEGKVDLGASPAKYIPELKGSGFERVTIQQVLDHTTAIDFKENYTDLESDFALLYAPALNLGWLPGAADVQPDDAQVYGVQDFLVHVIKPDPALQPGAAFDYNSSNADLLGWLVARISGETLQDYVQQHLWAKLGAEHDAYMAVDRALIPVATAGMNTTLRDAARFGMMIRDRGEFAGKQVIPAEWIDTSLQVSDKVAANMAANAKYGEEPWAAYHNMWWILDADKGEYCAVGIHGQVIYINRSADTVMVWFSSQPVASAARNPEFRAKLQAARDLAASLTRKPGLSPFTP